MEEEFYNFVSPTEIAKDLNLPEELATKIHKYWALKRKVSFVPVVRADTCFIQTSGDFE